MGEFDPRAIARLDPYLLPEERIRVAMQEHWAAKVEPVATALVGFILVLSVGAFMPARLGMLSDIAWWLWFALLARVAWVFIEWRVSWFIATNKRLLLLYGVITRKVAMMPLAKVTDMSYSRSPLGQLLGYGTFTLESAGQDQALHRITFVRNPDVTYRTICEEIFGNPDPADAWPGDAAGEEGDPDNPDGPPGPGPRNDDGPGPRTPDDHDNTDLPVQSLGSYLAPSDRSSYGRRWVRRGRRRREDEPDIPGIISADAPGWEVSREDASSYESVPRRTDGWWD